MMSAELNRLEFGVHSLMPLSIHSAETAPPPHRPPSDWANMLLLLHLWALPRWGMLSQVGVAEPGQRAWADDRLGTAPQGSEIYRRQYC